MAEGLDLLQREKEPIGPACYNPQEVGPLPRKNEENLKLVAEDLVKFNFSNQVYLDTDPAIDSNWISQIGERYGFPFGLEFGKIFKIANISFNANFLGYYNKFFGLPGQEYALRAQISFPFPN